MSLVLSGINNKLGKKEASFSSTFNSIYNATVQTDYNKDIEQITLKNFVLVKRDASYEYPEDVIVISKDEVSLVGSHVLLTVNDNGALFIVGIIVTENTDTFSITLKASYQEPTPSNPSYMGCVATIEIQYANELFLDGDSITITGDSVIQGNSVTEGSSEVQKDLTIKGDGVIQGSSEVHGNLVVNGNLEVEDLEVRGNLTVNKDIRVEGKIYVRTSGVNLTKNSFKYLKNEDEDADYIHNIRIENFFNASSFEDETSYPITLLFDIPDNGLHSRFGVTAIYSNISMNNLYDKRNGSLEWDMDYVNYYTSGGPQQKSKTVTVYYIWEADTNNLLLSIDNNDFQIIDGSGGYWYADDFDFKSIRGNYSGNILSTSGPTYGTGEFVFSYEEDGGYQEVAVK